MKITKEQLRTIVGEVLQEEKDYQSFFKAMLKKHGVSSPDEFKSDEDKKAFFNKVEDTWKGVSERLQTLKEDELTAKQQKIDLNKNGKVDGDDLSKLRAGAKTEGEMQTSTSLTKILSKEGETLVKSGAGNMYNITKVNESKEGDILIAKIEKLRLDAEAGKIKTLDQFLDKFVPLQKRLKELGESVNEAMEDGEWVGLEKTPKGPKLVKTFKSGNQAKAWVMKSTGGHSIMTKKQWDLSEGKSVNEAFPTKKVDAKVIADRMRNHKETKGFADKIEKLKMVSAEDLDKMLPDYVDGGVITKIFKESVNEGKYDADLDKIEAAVKNALSFMNVGAELRKAGIKYDFSTSMIPMYMIKVSGTLIAIVNKKHANGPERVVGDIAIGVLN